MKRKQRIKERKWRERRRIPVHRFQKVKTFLIILNCVVFTAVEEDPQVEKELNSIEKEIDDGLNMISKEDLWIKNSIEEKIENKIKVIKRKILEEDFWIKSPIERKIEDKTKVIKRKIFKENSTISPKK